MSREQVGFDLKGPHSAYLEFLLDNGFLGAITVLLFFGTAVFVSARLLRDKADPLNCAVGGTAFSLVLAYLIAGIGGLHFYPAASYLGMWAAILLMFRAAMRKSEDTPSVAPPLESGT